MAIVTQITKRENKPICLIVILLAIFISYFEHSYVKTILITTANSLL